MHDWLDAITRDVALVVNVMALVIIVIGTVEAFIVGLGVMFRPSATGHERREAWLRYARWLVAGLTFQLAADLIETAIKPSWDELARLTVVALVRILLNLSLEHDVSDMRERQRRSEAATPK